MGRLRLAPAACGFGRRALSGFFIDAILIRHVDCGAVLDWRARESLRGDCRKCDRTAFRALLTPAVVVSFCVNARKAFRSRNIRVSATRLALRGSRGLPLRRCAWPMPVVALASISVDVCHGDSIAAMTTLFNVRADEFFAWLFAQTAALRADWSFRPLDSVRVEAREGTAGECSAHASICASNGTFRKRRYETKACDGSSITVACYLCNTHPKTA
jgi:hypothetical protein